MQSSSSNSYHLNHTATKSCDFCNRSFTRKEHLTRHRRIHTREKPFDCPHCTVTFQRSDVRDRHVQRLHTLAHSDTVEPPARARLACDDCRRLKLKCDNHSPCESCRIRDAACTRNLNRPGPGRPRKTGLQVLGSAVAGLESSSNVSIPTSLHGSELEMDGATSTNTYTIDSDASFMPNDTSISENISLMNNQPGLPPHEDTTSLVDFDSLLPDFDLGWNEDVNFLEGSWESPFWASDLAYVVPNALDPDAQPRNMTENERSPIEKGMDWIASHFAWRSHSPTKVTTDSVKNWHSTPPQLQMYDKDVINVLLNVSRRHLAPAFKLFANYEARSDTCPEQCLAMAAIGALYLGAECGIKLSKVLYNDARRLHFEKFHSSGFPSSFPIASDSLKTFILLSIYGLCSGDKRSFEFAEAFHTSMVQALRYYSHKLHTENDPATCQDLHLMIEAVKLVQCYRVLLLHRPPYMVPPTLFHAGFSSEANAGHDRSSLQIVADLGTNTWAASPHDQETTSWWRICRPEFVELGLDRWMNQNTPFSSPSNTSQTGTASMLIYYLAQIRLHVNVDFLQKSAWQFASIRSEQADAQARHTTMIEYRSKSQYAAALWYAQSMLGMIKGELNISHEAQMRSGQATTKRIAEVPHLPYCIYFGTLVVWYEEQAKSGSQSIVGDAIIRKGVRLLGLLKIRVAQVLVRTLSELLADDE